MIRVIKIRHVPTAIYWQFNNIRNNIKLQILNIVIIKCLCCRRCRWWSLDPCFYLLLKFGREKRNEWCGTTTLPANASAAWRVARGVVRSRLRVSCVNIRYNIIMTLRRHTYIGLNTSTRGSVSCVFLDNIRIRVLDEKYEISG